MKKRFFVGSLLVGLLFVCLGLAANVTAQGVDADIDTMPDVREEGAGGVALGLGLGIAPDYEGSDDYEGVPLPLVLWKFDNHMSITWAANRFLVNLIPSPMWKGGLAAQYIRERDDVDNDKVDKLDEVDGSFMLGGFLGFDTDHWKGSIEAMADVSDGNDGSIVRLRGGYKIPISKTWRLSINAFTTWASDDYMEAYFGIDAANSAKSGLATFDADSGFKDFGVTVPVLYSPWKHWSLLGIGAYKRLVGDAEDSPVVDDEGSENQFFGGVLLVYRF